MSRISQLSSTIHRGLGIEDLDRLLRGAQVVAGGAVAVAAALEVAGEHHCVGLAALLEPVARAAVPQAAVVVGQGRVRALAEQGVAERELALVGELARRAHREQLLIDQRRDPRVDLRRGAHPASRMVARDQAHRHLQL